MMGYSVERGLWLEDLCRKHGWKTTEVFGTMIGVERHSVARWWKGGPIKEFRHQQRICQLLDISLGQLLDGPYALGIVREPQPPTRFFNRRGSGWTHQTLLAIIASLVPAYEETLQKKGEDEVLRMILLQLSEMSPSFDVVRRVQDAIRHALYEVKRRREGLEPVRVPTLSEIKQIQEPDVEAPPEWRTGWESERQRQRRSVK